MKGLLGYAHGTLFAHQDQVFDRQQAAQEVINK